ncbi:MULTISPECIES: hypothetical protein [Bradyrhizobium]|uniref:hypothetical protein n=1 Tax=Bradyrhizobium TaxID=374 RepID=UPI001EDB5998|nr:hypothetical protein [Bradyrhizobium zhengyangense]MCG2645265.1 hypothetical protein [Bradyrhizobium zhengyangense]
MLVPYVLPMHLQTHVRGLFVVQEMFDPTEFAKLVEASDVIPKRLLADYCKDYEELAEYEGASIFRDVQLPWIIVVFKSEPRRIRGIALHETVHLADHMTCNPENRARFIEHVFMTFSDDLDDRQARH